MVLLERKVRRPEAWARLRPRQRPGGGGAPMAPTFCFSPERAISAKGGEVTEFQGSALVAVWSLFVFDCDLFLVPVIVSMRTKRARTFLHN